MSLNLVDIGNEGEFMERWAQEQDRVAAGLLALDMVTGAAPSKKAVLVSTPSRASGRYFDLYAKAKATLGSELPMTDILGTELPNKLGKPILTRADIDRAIKELEPLLPKPTDWVELEMNPEMAEIVGAPAVAIHRGLYDSLVSPVIPRFVDVSAKP